MYLYYSQQHCKHFDFLISSLGTDAGKQKVCYREHSLASIPLFFCQPLRSLQPTHVIHHGDINYVLCSSKTKTLMKDLSTQGLGEISGAMQVGGTLVLNQGSALM